MNNDLSQLIADLQHALQNTAADQADAARWRMLIDYVQRAGYGPAITPEMLAGLLPDANRIQEVATASQPSAAKSSHKGRPLGPRRPKHGNGHEPGAAPVAG
jgi:hypothetical protein